jgi:SHS2 domain-containing protein
VTGGYRFAEHVGEVEVELEASTERGIFEAALAAFAELAAGGDEAEPARHEIALDAADHALLLVDWLGELVFLAEVDGFLPGRATRLELAGNALRATVEGRRGHPRHLVKAVTLSRLELRQEDGAWHGRVVLDV